MNNAYYKSDKAKIAVTFSFRSGGSKLHGVTIHLLEEFARKDIDTLAIVETLSERKQKMIDESDFVLAKCQVE